MPQGSEASWCTGLARRGEHSAVVKLTMCTPASPPTGCVTLGKLLSSESHLHDGFISWTFLIGLLRIKTSSGTSTEPVLNKSQLLLGLLFLRQSHNVALVFLST